MNARRVHGCLTPRMATRTVHPWRYPHVPDHHHCDQHQQRTQNLGAVRQRMKPATNHVLVLGRAHRSPDQPRKHGTDKARTRAGRQRPRNRRNNPPCGPGVTTGASTGSAWVTGAPVENDGFASRIACAHPSASDGSCTVAGRKHLPCPLPRPARIDSPPAHLRVTQEREHLVHRDDHDTFNGGDLGELARLRPSQTDHRLDPHTQPLRGVSRHPLDLADLRHHVRALPTRLRAAIPVPPHLALVHADLTAPVLRVNEERARRANHDMV